MNKMFNYPFAIFRIILGCYLTIHFIQLIPFVGEIWGPNGTLSSPSLNLTHGVVPNVLSWANNDLFTAAFLVILSVASIGLTIGFQRPLFAIIIWYGWVCLFDRNNLIANPGLPFIGLLLLMLSAIPRGEPLSFSKQSKRDQWKLPKLLYVGAWVIMAVSYSISGLDKLGAPSWTDGSAITHLLNNPLARDSWLRELLLAGPEGLRTSMTYAILGLELAFAPLCLFRVTRKWAWISMVLMHLGILTFVDFADLTIGMLMIHLFTFDPRWLKSKPSTSERILFFDGVCGLCNSSVDFFIQQDVNDVLKCAPLQSDIAVAKIPDHIEGPMETLVYKDDSGIYTHSTAVIKAAAAIGGFWKLALVLYIIPTGLRDVVYRWVSRNRYKWFGQKETCRMPTESERSKILW